NFITKLNPGAVVSRNENPDYRNVTLFTVPKAFKGHIGVIQRNAIISWTKLEPRPEIILLGNDEGIKEIAEEFNLKHIPEVKCNEFNTPLISSIFETAEAHTDNEIMAFINTDVILLDDFIQAM